MKRLTTIVLVVIFNTGLILGQSADFTKKFSDAEYHLQYKNYTEALPLYVELANADPNNGNVNYKAGFCYLMTAGDKSRAIPYLEKASTMTSKAYEEFSPNEKRAPEITFYDLGNAYQINMQFDKAQELFNKYKALVGTKNKELAAEIDRHIAMCQFADASIKKPVNVTIKNLGNAVNTKYPESEPILSQDESSLMYNSKREGFGNYQNIDGQYFESALISNEKNGQWSVGSLLSPNINLDENDAILSISADGSKLLCWKDDKANGSIMLSEAKGESWNTPIELGANINTKAVERGACITPDGNTIFFASDRKGGIGGMDLYRSEKGADGIWGIAVNLGSSVNTPYDEIAPVLSVDGKTLYFASQGHDNMGGFDILKSTYNPGDKSFGTPVNLGYPINSPDDEMSFTPTMDGRKAYYSTTRKDGQGGLDIYEIVFNDAKPAAMTIFKGTVINNVDTSATLFPPIVATVSSNSGTANYNGNYNTGGIKFAMQPGAKYTVKVTVDGVEKYSEDFDLTSSTSFQEVNKKIYMKDPGETPEQKEARLAAEKAAADAKAAAEAKAAEEAAKKAAEDKAKEEAWKKDPKNKGKKYTGNVPASSLPLPPNEFKTYFKYNKTAIDGSNKDFMAFIKGLSEMIKSGQSVTVSIEASASKVPTTKFGTNDALAAKRADDAKNKIISMLKSKGVDTSKVNFNTPVSSVGGPEYNKDFNERRSEYEKYQYVDISAK